VLGDAVEAERLGRADDRLAVEGDERQVDGLAPGGHQDLLRLERDLAPLIQPDDHRLGRRDPRRAEDGLDPVLLEEATDAAGQPLDDLVLAGLHRGDVDLEAADLDPVAGEPFVRQVI
jgi:hypothetical protein